jgi:GLPGLI family protein
MKYNLSYILFFFTIFLYTQTVPEKYSVSVIYSMTLSFDEAKKHDCLLNFNENYALFEWKQVLEKSNKTLNASIENDINKGKVSIDITDKSSRFIFSNTKTKLWYEKKPKLDNQFILKEKMENIFWKISDSTKTIGKIDCKLATTNFRGRLYFAWYSLNIPSYWGPWKLHGLPGLIVEVYDSTKEIYIIATEIKKTDTLINRSILDNYSILTKDEWEKEKSEFSNNLKNKLFRNLPRSAKITNYKVTEKKDFEIN